MLSRRGAIGISFTGGGEPFGFSAWNCASRGAAAADLPVFAVLPCCCACAREPARSAGDIPRSDRSFRLFMAYLKTMADTSHPVADSRSPGQPPSADSLRMTILIGSSHPFVDRDAY